MKRFLIRLFVFITPLAVLIILSVYGMNKILMKTHGPNTQVQIESQFKNALSKDYEMLILGNSRTYRGLNPDIFTKKTFNFSHDNDSFNQMYYKLRLILENNKKISYCTIGIDYFEFSFISDTRNYVYFDFLDKDYSQDYTNKNRFKLKADYYLSNLSFNKIKSLRKKGNKPFLKENGQYIYPGQSKKDDYIEREIERLEIQENYFEKLIDLCEKENITMFFVMLPIRSNELENYNESQIKEFNSYILQSIPNSDYYLNYSTSDGFTDDDYTDITHLNAEAADRFSKILNKDILSLMAQD